MIAALVYLTCALTSVLCATMLFLKFKRTRVRFLFWSFLCFAGLAVNNVLLFVDMVIIPSHDLSGLRLVPAVAGYALLIWGFIWESE